MNKKASTDNERGQGVLRKLDSWLGRPLCLAWARPRWCKRALPTSPARIGVMIFGAIGDALLASSLLSSLRAAYPNAKLVLFLSNGNKGVAQLIAGYDEITLCPITRPHQAIGVIRKAKVDLLIDTSQWARISALVARFSGAKCTVGFKTPQQGRGWGYDIVTEHSPLRHELDNFRALARAAGGHEHTQPCLDPASPFPAAQFGIHRQFVVFHPWAAGYKSHLREWPETNWHTLACRLVERGLDVVISGGPSDIDVTRSLMHKFEDNPHVISLAGQLSLTELRDCLSASEAVVSVNTGVMHLASLLDVPTLSLNGPTNGDRWGGIGSNTCNINVPADQGGGFLNLGFEYPAEDRVIMDKISVDQVFSSLMTHIKSAEQR